jgi:hypothetical protein
MKYEDTLHSALLNYPTLWGYDDYQELRVMDHLFLTIGNGYEWKRGQLVEKFPERKLSWQMYIEKAFRPLDTLRIVHDTFTVTKLDAEKVPEHLKWCMTEEGIVNHFVEEERTRGLWFYPVSERYSRGFNVPADIHPDWKAALIRFLEKVVELGPERFVGESHENDVHGWEEAQCSYNLCCRQLQKLKANE